ncbi:MAG: septum formation protein Maf [Ruminococcus sp.]|nr:septum formation protein Maf [Ruminococcus sp.]
MNIILASASPRRKELMGYIVPRFEIIPADVDETLPKEIPAEKSAEFLAVKKAEHISAQYPESIVIGSDTVVIVDGEILGKPADEADAYRMLKKLSGKVHTVITGVCIFKGEKKKSFSEATRVEFYPLSEEEIRGYIATGDPMDKAGAYGIQGEGCVLIKGIEGDFFTVMGLPAARLKRELAEFTSMKGDGKNAD